MKTAITSAKKDEEEGGVVGVGGQRKNGEEEEEEEGDMGEESLDELRAQVAEAQKLTGKFNVAQWF